MAREKAYVWAEAVVAALLESGGVELASRSSRSALETVVAAHLLRGDVHAPALADSIMRVEGVSELHVEDDALAETVRRTQPTNAEVAVSDAAALAIQAAMAKASPPQAAPPPPNPLEKLAPDARAVVDAAKRRAREAGHLRTTLDHVLVEILSLPKTVELAKRRGGRPEQAKAEAEARLARLERGSPVASTPPVDDRVLAAVTDAEELAPHLVSVGDLALAAMQPERNPHPLFVLAFARNDGPSPKPVRAALEEVGPFTTSKELTEALSYLFRLPEARSSAQRALGSATLSAYVVDATERELETSLPEDFWAAAAAGLQAFADLGIAASSDEHGEPAEREEIGEVVLTAMSAAESADLDLEVEGAPLVAFMSVDPSAETDFLCVRRGVSRAERNRQPVFVVNEDGVTEYASFGAWVLAVSRER